MTVDSTTMWTQENCCVLCGDSCPLEQQKKAHVLKPRHVKKEKVQSFYVKELPKRAAVSKDSILFQRYQKKKRKVVGLECLHEIHLKDKPEVFWSCSLCFVAGSSFEAADAHLQDPYHIRSYLVEYHSQEMEKIDDIAADCDYLFTVGDGYYEKNGVTLPPEIIELDFSHKEVLEKFGLSDVEDFTEHLSPNDPNRTIIICTTCKEPIPCTLSDKYTIKRAKKAHLSSTEHLRRSFFLQMLDIFNVRPNAEVDPRYKKRNHDWKKVGNAFHGAVCGLRYAVIFEHQTLCELCYCTVDSLDEHFSSEYHLLRFAATKYPHEIYLLKYLSPEERRNGLSALLWRTSLENDETRRAMISALPPKVTDGIRNDTRLCEDLMPSLGNAEGNCIFYCSVCNTISKATNERMKKEWRSHCETFEHYYMDSRRACYFHDEEALVPWVSSVPPLETEQRGSWKEVVLETNNVRAQSQCNIGLNYLVDDEDADEMVCLLCAQVFQRSSSVYWHFRTKDHTIRYIFKKFAEKEINDGRLVSLMMKHDNPKKVEQELLEFMLKNTTFLASSVKVYSFKLSRALEALPPVPRHQVDTAYQSLPKDPAKKNEIVIPKSVSNLSVRHALLWTNIEVLKSFEGEGDKAPYILCRCKSPANNHGFNPQAVSADVFQHHLGKDPHKCRLSLLATNKFDEFGFVSSVSYNFKEFNKGSAKKMAWHYDTEKKRFHFVLTIVGFDDVVERWSDFPAREELPDYFCKVCAHRFEHSDEALEEHLRSGDHVMCYVNKHIPLSVPDIEREVKALEVRRMVAKLLKGLPETSSGKVRIYDPVTVAREEQAKEAKEAPIEKKTQEKAKAPPPAPLVIVQRPFEDPETFLRRKRLEEAQMPEQSKQSSNPENETSSVVTQEGPPPPPPRTQLFPVSLNVQPPIQQPIMHPPVFQPPIIPPPGFVQPTIQTPVMQPPMMPSMAMPPPSMPNPMMSHPMMPSTMIPPPFFGFSGVPPPNIPIAPVIPPPPKASIPAPKLVVPTPIQTANPAAASVPKIKPFKLLRPEERAVSPPPTVRKRSLASGRPSSTDMAASTIKSRNEMLELIITRNAESIPEDELPTEFNECLAANIRVVGAERVFEVICADDTRYDSFYCTCCKFWSAPGAMIEHLVDDSHLESYLYAALRDLYYEGFGPYKTRSLQKCRAEARKRRPDQRVVSRMCMLLDAATMKRFWPDYKADFYTVKKKVETPPSTEKSLWKPIGNAEPVVEYGEDSMDIEEDQEPNVSSRRRSVSRDRDILRDRYPSFSSQKRADSRNMEYPDERSGISSRSRYEPRSKDEYPTEKASSRRRSRSRSRDRERVWEKEKHRAGSSKHHSSKSSRKEELKKKTKHSKTRRSSSSSSSDEREVDDVIRSFAAPPGSTTSRKRRASPEANERGDFADKLASLRDMTKKGLIKATAIDEKMMSGISRRRMEEESPPQAVKKSVDATSMRKFLGMLLTIDKDRMMTGGAVDPSKIHGIASEVGLQFHNDGEMNDILETLAAQNASFERTQSAEPAPKSRSSGSIDLQSFGIFNSGNSSLPPPPKPHYHPPTTNPYHLPSLPRHPLPPLNQRPYANHSASQKNFTEPPVKSDELKRIMEGLKKTKEQEDNRKFSLMMKPQNYTANVDEIFGNSTSSLVYPHDEVASNSSKNSVPTSLSGSPDPSTDSPESMLSKQQRKRLKRIEKLKLKLKAEEEAVNEERQQRQDLQAANESEVDQSKQNEKKEQQEEIPLIVFPRLGRSGIPNNWPLRGPRGPTETSEANTSNEQNATTTPAAPVAPGQKMALARTVLPNGSRVSSASEPLPKKDAAIGSASVAPQNTLTTSTASTPTNYSSEFYLNPPPGLFNLPQQHYQVPVQQQPSYVPPPHHVQPPAQLYHLAPEQQYMLQQPPHLGMPPPVKQAQQHRRDETPHLDPGDVFRVHETPRNHFCPVLFVRSSGVDDVAFCQEPFLHGKSLFGKVAPYLRTTKLSKSCNASPVFSYAEKLLFLDLLLSGGFRRRWHLRIRMFFAAILQRSYPRRYLTSAIVLSLIRAYLLSAATIGIFLGSAFEDQVDLEGPSQNDHSYFRIGRSSSGIPSVSLVASSFVELTKAIGLRAYDPFTECENVLDQTSKYCVMPFVSGWRLPNLLAAFLLGTRHLRPIFRPRHSAFGVDNRSKTTSSAVAPLRYFCT
ncbi:unnamed protein product [Caenorhabditis auriculariae]|uniref:C2H2-type domain-containing protein n=1 Tax=Caenorhabditis auriculariae TaxID=2777116 RepID=A0A8S1GWM8_9PELO|nr:unnamed protein product [Caenorhabditis auriculariae]